MGRNITDKLHEITKALPAAAASADSDSIDLNEGWKGENFEVQIDVPALTALVDTKTATFTLNDSADNSSFAAVTGLSALVLTGAGGAGAAATKRTVRIPDGTRRYIRLNMAVETGGGNNTAKSATLRLLF